MNKLTFLMKQSFVLTLILIFACLYAKAQDLLIKNDGTEIECKVAEIGPETISYYKQTQPSGPLYVERRSDVFMVKFANGEKEVFANDQKQRSNRDNQELGVLLITNPKTIHSDSLWVGQLIDFNVTDDFFHNETLLFQAGDLIQAEVLFLEKRSFLGKPGKMQLGFLPATALDGVTKVHFGKDLYQIGQDKMVESVILGALVFWPMLLLRGKAVIIQPNTSMGLDAYLK